MRRDKAGREREREQRHRKDGPRWVLGRDRDSALGREGEDTSNLSLADE